MEFKFNLRNILGDEITLLDNKLTTYKTSSGDYKRQLCEVIDKAGIASAKAQNLHAAITSATRLMHSDHHLYIMKEEDTGDPEMVVGLLKMGHKKLFVYDIQGNQHEMEPLCVLDFYIHESRQRKGLGKKLFEYMLKCEGVRPVHLAIDRPSAKFIGFLHKHYNLKATINQVNNYVIFDGFFRDRPAEAKRGRGNKAPVHPYINKGDEKKTSQHGDTASIQREKEALNHIALPRPNSHEDTPSTPGSGGRQAGAGDQIQSGGLAAQDSSYSRHGVDLHQPSQTVADVNINTTKTQHSESTSPIQRRRDGLLREYNALKNEAKIPLRTQQPYTSSSTGDTEATVDRGWPSGASTQDQIARMNSTSWNLFGVPASSSQPAGQRTQKSYSNTRLW